MPGPVEKLSKITDEPLRNRLKAEHASMVTVPVVRWWFIDGPSFGLPIRKDFPIVILAVAAMTPVGGTGQNQVDAGRGQKREEVECIPYAEKPSSLFNFGLEVGSDIPQSRLAQRHILYSLIEQRGALPFEGAGHD